MFIFGLSIYLYSPTLGNALKAEVCHTLHRGHLKAKQRRKDADRLAQDNSGGCTDPIEEKRRIKKEKKENGKKKTEKVYSCMLCEKDFNTHCGLKSHVRSHKCCKGCKNVFPSKSVFNSHKLTCQKYKILMNRRGRPSEQNEARSSSCMPSMSHNKHYIVNEKTLKCSLCPKTFQVNKALKLHMTRIHIKKKNLSNTNEDSSWTMPLELTDTLSLWQVSHFNLNVVIRVYALSSSLFLERFFWRRRNTMKTYIFILLVTLPAYLMLVPVNHWMIFFSLMTSCGDKRISLCNYNAKVTVNLLVESPF